MGVSRRDPRCTGGWALERMRENHVSSIARSQVHMYVIFYGGEVDVVLSR
jgi:hypothetical protein